MMPTGAAPVPAASPAPAQSPPARTRGWWRRNVWGLVLLLPLTAGLFALNRTIIYERNFAAAPRLAAAVDGTGKAVLDGYAVRLIEAVPVPSDQLDVVLAGRPPLPSTVRPWRVILSVAGPPDSFVGNCRAELVTEDGLAYPASPDELAFTSSSLSHCHPDDSRQPSPYVTTLYMLLPADQEPAGVRITWDSRLPRYIYLPVP
jgi:hypothetical protein